MSTSQANKDVAACEPVQNDCICLLTRYLHACAVWVLTNVQGSTPWVHFTTLHTYKYYTSENNNEHKSSKYSAKNCNDTANHSP